MASTAFAAIALLAGCTAAEPSIESASSDIEPINLSNADEIAALCDESAVAALEFVQSAADADAESDERTALASWGIEDTSDNEVIQLKLDDLTARTEVPCEDVEAGADRVGVEEGDGTVTNLPLVTGEGNDPIVVDTTRDAATPPLVQPPLMDGDLRFTAQSLSWQGLVERVGDQQGYKDGIDQFQQRLGFTWNDALRFAEVNKVGEDGKIQGVNALAIQIYNQPNLTDEQARDQVRQYITPKEEEVIGLTVEELPIQRINNGFVNTRNIGTLSSLKVGTYFDTQAMVRVSLMPLKFNEAGDPVSLDATKGAGIFIDCGNLHWVPTAIWYCTDDKCEKPTPPAPPVTPCQHNCNPTPPDDRKPWHLNTERPSGWTPLQAGPLTNGQESEQQHQSGDVRGNVTDNPVAPNTQSGSTTPELPSNTGITAPGATPNPPGTNLPEAPRDTSNTVDNTGGTDGATEIAPPAD